MQWAFLVLALCAALAELHSGTFYLAGVAAASLATFAVGFWIRGDLLVIVFFGFAVILIAGGHAARRTLGRSTGVPDFDIGQTVTVIGPDPSGDFLLVTYRGTQWEAVAEDGAALPAGSHAVILRKTDKLLHLTKATPPART